MKESRVRVFNPKVNGWMGTQYEINGNQVNGVKSVDFHVAVDDVPRFTFEMMGMPDIELVGDIRFQFTPKTVQEAAVVIGKEFRPDSEYFKATVSAVEERLRAYIPDHMEVFRALAEDIVRQVLGV